MRRLALALLCAAGCSDFDLVEPVRTEPSIGVTVNVTHADSTWIALSSRLFLGSDSRGSPNAFTDNAISIDGVRVGPTLGFNTPTTREYSWQSRMAAATVPDTLALRLPTFAFRATPYVIGVPIPARLDAELVSLQPGDDLTLHVSPMPGIIQFAAFPVAWTVRLRRDCDETGGVGPGGTGDYPAEIVVASGVLAAVSGSDFEACFRATRAYVSSGNEPYKAVVDVVASVVWKVRWVSQ